MNERQRWVDFVAQYKIDGADLIAECTKTHKDHGPDFLYSLSWRATWGGEKYVQPFVLDVEAEFPSDEGFKKILVVLQDHVYQARKIVMG